MSIPVPTLVRLEYWSVGAGDWSVAHASMNLLDPGKYVQKLLARNIIARAIDKDTGQIFYGVEGSDLL